MKANEKEERIVYILNGLGGSGKTYQAQKRIALNEKAGVKTTRISANDYHYTIDKQFKFDPDQVSHYHRLSFMDYLCALDMRDPVVIVDNTNIFHTFRRPYIDAAEQAGYRWEHVLVGSFDPDFARFCVARSTHGLSLDYVMAMAERYEKPFSNYTFISKEDCGWTPNWNKPQEESSYQFWPRVSR